LEGSSIGELSERGEPIVGDSLCVLINAQFHDLQFKMPYHRRTAVVVGAVHLAGSNSPKRTHLAGWRRVFNERSFVGAVYIVQVPKRDCSSITNAIVLQC